MNPKDVMAIDHIDDWEMRLARQDAFWECEIIDRPVVHFSVPGDNKDYLKPKEKQFDSLKDRWLDAEYIAEHALYNVMHRKWMGDALPSAWPNLGPEVFSAFFGMEMEYGERTAWGVPNLKDWSDVGDIKFSEDNFYWKKCLEMTNALLEVGKGKFYTGYTDIHPGGDCVAGFRDPMDLNFDMIDSPEKVKDLVTSTNKDFIKIMGLLRNLLQVEHKQAATTWMGIVSSQVYHILGNDFSSMISTDMFRDLFLEGLNEEASAVDKTIFHVDGPGVLNHFDAILDIKNLQAIQWVYGAGNGTTTDWLDLYKKSQAAKKAIWLHVHFSEIDTLIENLRPEGVFMIVTDVKNEEHGDEIIKKVSKWR